MSLGVPMPMMVGIMLPAIGAARRTAQQMQGSTKVREIQGSCMLYAHDHDGAFPPDLATLVENSFFPLETIFLGWVTYRLIIRNTSKGFIYFLITLNAIFSLLNSFMAIILCVVLSTFAKQEFIDSPKAE